MLFILNRRYEVMGTLNHKGDLSRIVPYFDDKYVRDLTSGAETFTFTTIANTKQAQHLTVGNYIVFREGKEFKLFNIINVHEEHTEVFTKTVYCEMAGIGLTNDKVRPMELPRCDVKRFMNTILADTVWQLGKFDIGLNQVFDFKLTEIKSAYDLIQEYVVKKFGGEINYRVEFSNGRITGRYIDVYAERGRFKGKRFDYNTNMTSVAKDVDISELATALIGIGKNNTTFKSIETPDKPLNQDFIVNEQAYKLWNIDGDHLFGTFSADTDNPHELLKLTREESIKRGQPKVKYDLKVELLGSEVELGETCNIVDQEFNPPLYLTGRISQLTTSRSDPSSNECILSNFKEQKSSITEEMRKIAEGYVSSQFPIGGDKILDGAIDEKKVSKTFKTFIIADCVTATLIETEKLVAEKADIESLQAVKAQIGELKTGVVIADKLESIEGNIQSLESSKVSTQQLETNLANVTHLIAEKVSTTEFSAGIAEIQNTITTNLNATNASIKKLIAKDAEIENVVAESVTATKAKIENLETNLANITTLVSKKATIEELNATNANIEKLNSKVAEIDNAVVDNFKATTAEITNLKSNDAKIEKLVAEKVDISELKAINGKFETVNSNVANLKKAFVDKAEIVDGKINNLESTTASISSALIKKADIEDLKATNAEIEKLKVKDLEFEKAIGKKLEVKDLETINADIKNLKVETAEISKVKASVGEIDNLLAGNLTAINFKAGCITADSAIIADGAIGTAQIGELSANVIKSGELDTAKVKVKSTNGEIEMSGYQILINDTSDIKNKVNRVTLGKYNKADGSTDYGLLIRGKDGKTVMMDADGVHNAGITNGAIDNNKIADNAGIEGKKLEIESVVTHINGAKTKIEGTSIVVDNKNLGVTIQEIENSNKEMRQANSEIKANMQSINLSVQEVNTKIGDNKTQIEKNKAELQLQKDEIALKVNSDGIINAISLDSSGAKIKGKQIDLTGVVTLDSLDNTESGFDGIFKKEFKKTVIDGGKILTGSIKADTIDLRGLTIKELLDNGIERESLRITSNGAISLSGNIESFDYDEELKTGWCLNKDGNATLNNATIRGSVILPSAGMTNHSSGKGDNIFLNSDYSETYDYDGYEWDKKLNGKTGAKYWGDYNGGVTNPKTGYHAHVNTTTFDFNVFEFKAVNNERWLGSTQNIEPSIHQFKKDTTYYFSMDVYFTEVGQQVDGGLYYKIDEKNGFHSGMYKLVAKEEHLNKWFRLTWSFKLDNKAQLDRGFTWYNYGYEGKPSQKSYYIKNCLLTTTNTNIWSVNEREKNNVVRIWAGDTYENRNKAPFRVMQNGDIYAENGTFKGTFSGKIEVGNILIQDTTETTGVISFMGQDKKPVLNINENNILLGRNTVIGDNNTNLSITETSIIANNKDVSISRIDKSGKSKTIVGISKDNDRFLTLNNTHTLITKDDKLIIEGNHTRFTNDISVGNNIITENLVVGNMQIKRKDEQGNKGIDFIFI